MKKKQIIFEEKLFLHKETVAALNDLQKEDVSGGANTIIYVPAVTTGGVRNL